MTQMTTVTTDALGTIELPLDDVVKHGVAGKKPWRHPVLKVLPQVKANYKGKNISGGRKCIFSQSKAYKNPVSHAIPWHWPYAHDNKLSERRK